jgi:glycosyltransferase involved in cell wall biosynthesis
VTVVTAFRFQDFFRGAGNVDFFSGVSDSELLRLYRDADLLLLPLLDSTANNSLLEGMACGLPIVSTDLPGIRDYVDEASAILCPRSDAGGLADGVLCIRKDPDMAVKMGAASRVRSLEFDWRRIARQMNTVYEKTMERL